MPHKAFQNAVTPATPATRATPEITQALTQTEELTVNKGIIVYLFFAEKRNPFSIIYNNSQNI